MLRIGDYRRQGSEMEQILNLRDAPVALKVLYKNDDVPGDSLRPYRDSHKHYAMCQAMTVARHHRRTITLLKEDHWCIWPLISFGMVALDENDLEYLGDKHFMKDVEASRKYFRKEYPRLNTEKEVVGFILAPLSDCMFEPDIICVYCQPGQLRSLLMAAKYETGKVVQSSLDTCDSCVHATIPVLNGEKDYNLSIPDPGEYERGLCDENELIFTMKGDRLGEIMSGLHVMNKGGFGFRQLAMDMNLDYSRPEFYNNMFEKWGLERGEIWDEGGRSR